MTILQHLRATIADRSRALKAKPVPADAIGQGRLTSEMDSLESLLKLHDRLEGKSSIKLQRT